MKVEIDTAALADAVAWTSRVIDARPSNPILAGVKLEAIDGTLQFSAFNYEISARHHIEAGVDEAGSVLVQGKLLADITKSLRSEKTYLVTDGSTLTITSGKSKFTLQLMPDTEYPDLPVVPAMLGQVDAPTFVQAVNQACVAVSREENRWTCDGSIRWTALRRLPPDWFCPDRSCRTGYSRLVRNRPLPDSMSGSGRVRDGRCALANRWKFRDFSC